MIRGEVTDPWVNLVRREAGVRQGIRLLDLGCGTGRWAIAFAAGLGVEVTGADAEPAMLDRARQKHQADLVTWDVENADDLTYPAAAFDVVFMSHLIHHVQSPTKAIANCRRILRPGGTLLIRYGAIEQIAGDVEHTFFPEALDIDRRRTPSIADVEAMMHGSGFTAVTSHEVTQQTCTTAAEHVERARNRSTSVLHLISAEAFRTGLAALTEHARTNPDDRRLLEDTMTLTIGRCPRTAAGGGSAGPC